MDAGIEPGLVDASSFGLTLDVLAQAFDPVLVGVLHVALPAHQLRHDVVVQGEVQAAPDPGDQKQRRHDRDDMDDRGAERDRPHARAARHG